MSIPVTPVTKLKKPLALLLAGEMVSLFHHEKGSDYCVVDFPNGESKVAALCDLSLVGKQRQAIAKVSAGKVKPVDEYKAFYESLWQRDHFHCMSCRKPLYALNKAARRAVSAHCLPKAIFPSIATNPHNVVYLGVIVFGSCCNCHGQYDASVETRVKMPIYETVLKRFELLKPFLNAKELIMASEYLGITTKSLNLSRDLAGSEGVKV